MTSIGYATLQVIPSAKGFASALTADAAGDSVMAGRGMGQNLGGGMLAAAKSFVGPLAATFAVGGAVSFFKDTITQASGLGESVNALNVVFGDASAGVQDLGRQAAQSLGLSNLDFNNLAVRFSGFSKTIAGEGGDVVGTLEQITGRAADFASVMNLDVNEAAQLFQSGLAGETEPLRRFGIDLSAASVQAFAYANGIAETGTELTEAQKVQARYGLLMESTAQTAGDFANTSDALANQQRILGATWADLSAKIGVLLLPAVTAVVSAMNTYLMPTIDRVVTGIGALIELLDTGDFTSAIGDALGVPEDSGLVNFLLGAREAVLGFFDLIVNVGQGLAPLGDAFAGIDLSSFLAVLNPVGAIFRGMLPVLPLLVDSIVAIATALGGALGQILPVVAGLLAEVGAALGGAIVAIMPTVVSLVEGLVEVMVQMYPVLADVADALMGALGDALTALLPMVIGLGRVIGSALLAIMPSLVGLLQSLGGIFTSLLPALVPLIGLLGGAFAQILTALVPIVAQIVTLLADRLTALMPTIVEILTVLIEVVVSVLDAIMPLIPVVLGLLEAFLPLLPVLTDLIGILLPPLADLLGLLAPLIGFVAGVITAALVPVINILTTVIGVVIGWIADLIGWFTKTAEGAGDLGTRLSGIWSSISSTAQGIWNGLVSFVSQIPSRFVSGLRSLGTTVATSVGGWVSSIKDAAVEKFEAMVEFVRGIPGEIVSALGNMGRTLYNSGKNLIQGLIDGAGSLLRKIGEFFLDLLPGWIVAPFKSALGIHSPSKVFAGFGENIGEGVLDGVARTKGDIDSAMGDLVTPPNAPAFASPNAGDGLASTLAASVAMPTVLEVRDVDGDLIGRMQVEAGRVQEGDVTPLHLGRSSW